MTCLHSFFDTPGISGFARKASGHVQEPTGCRWMARSRANRLEDNGRHICDFFGPNDANVLIFNTRRAQIIVPKFAHKLGVHPILRQSPRKWPSNSAPFRDSYTVIAKSFESLFINLRFDGSQHYFLKRVPESGLRMGWDSSCRSALWGPTFNPTS
jgi:hypothetical protein